MRVKLLAGAAVCEELTGMNKSTSELTHVAAGGGLLFLTMSASPWGCSGHSEHDLPQNQQSGRGAGSGGV